MKPVRVSPPIDEQLSVGMPTLRMKLLAIIWSGLTGFAAVSGYVANVPWQ
jgi:hypothetical protein